VKLTVEQNKLERLSLANFVIQYKTNLLFEIIQMPHTPKYQNWLKNVMGKHSSFL
jgi:hypothetical protein